MFCRTRLPMCLSRIGGGRPWNKLTRVEPADKTHAQARTPGGDESDVSRVDRVMVIAPARFSAVRGRGDAAHSLRAAMAQPDSFGRARRLLADSSEGSKSVLAKPAPSRHFPALPPHPVADFVTTWAGYDNRNHPPWHYDASRRRPGLSRFSRLSLHSAPHTPSDWNIDHEL